MVAEAISFRMCTSETDRIRGFREWSDGLFIFITWDMGDYLTCHRVYMNELIN